jgi:hypothetical protein
MKARLTFDLSDPDDSRAHRRCIHSTGMALVLWELIHNSRKCKNIAEMHELINEQCYEHGIVINDLII